MTFSPVTPIFEKYITPYISIHYTIMKKTNCALSRALRQNIAILFCICLFVLLPSLLFAQDGLPGDPDVPIDGGLSLLVTAGVAYGIKKMSRKKLQETAAHK